MPRAWRMSSAGANLSSLIGCQPSGLHHRRIWASSRVVVWLLTRAMTCQIARRMVRAGAKGPFEGMRALAILWPTKSTTRMPEKTPPNQSSCSLGIWYFLKISKNRVCEGRKLLLARSTWHVQGRKSGAERQPREHQNLAEFHYASECVVEAMRLPSHGQTRAHGRLEQQLVLTDDGRQRRQTRRRGHVKPQELEAG